MSVCTAGTPEQLSSASVAHAHTHTQVYNSMCVSESKTADTPTHPRPALLTQWLKLSSTYTGLVTDRCSRFHSSYSATQQRSERKERGRCEAAKSRSAHRSFPHQTRTQLGCRNAEGRRGCRRACKEIQPIISLSCWAEQRKEKQRANLLMSEAKKMKHYQHPTTSTPIIILSFVLAEISAIKINIFIGFILF